MNFSVIVLIAAVAVNCLMTTINGEDATDTLAVPYIEMLLPPLEDVPNNNSKNVTAKANTGYKITTTATTTTATTSATTTTTTTKKPITNNVNNISPELSVEALLPPLFEAKIEQEETAASKKLTTTTKIPSITTTKKPLLTTSTTTLKPNSKVPDLFLDPLLPPLLDADSADATQEKAKAKITTTQKPATTAQNVHHLQQQKNKHLPVKNASNEIKKLNNSVAKNKHVAESRIIEKQVPQNHQQQDNKFRIKESSVKVQHVAKLKLPTTKYDKKQFNTNFQLYLGSTTTRPAKTGLPTITPFPRRLRR